MQSPLLSKLYFWIILWCFIIVWEKKLSSRKNIKRTHTTNCTHLKIMAQWIFIHSYAICIRIAHIYHPDKDLEHIPGAPSQLLGRFPRQSWPHVNTLLVSVTIDRFLPALEAHTESCSMFYLTCDLPHPIQCRQDVFIPYAFLLHMVFHCGIQYTTYYLSYINILVHFLCRNMCSFLLVFWLKMEFLDHREGICLIIIMITKEIFRVVVSIHHPLAMSEFHT